MQQTNEESEEVTMNANLAEIIDLTAMLTVVVTLVESGLLDSIFR